MEARASNIHTDAMIRSMTHGNPNIGTGSHRFGTDDADLTDKMIRFIEGQSDTTEETSRAGQDNVRELRQIRARLDRLIQLQPFPQARPSDDGQVLTGVP